MKPHRKRTTFAKYEIHVRLYLVPLLGSKRLESMSVADVRRAPAQLQKKTSAATAKESHRVLRTALTAACREELVSRNVDTLVEPPKVDSPEMDPWSLQETLDFLAAARADPLYPAFVIAIALGFRRGKIAGLRWENVDLDKREIRVRTQRQRVGGEAYEDRSFTRVAKDAGLRVVRLHDARHGTARLLTAAGVPPRVVMEILGHSQIAVTMNSCTPTSSRTPSARPSGTWTGCSGGALTGSDRWR